MRKTILPAVALTAGVAAALAFSGGTAHAQCYWNGYGMACATAPAPAYAQPYYPAYQDENWSMYYSAPYPNGKPAWLPSYPGPRPSGGAGW